MINYQFYSYRDNIISETLSDFVSEDTIFIYPTEKSKKAAVKAYQPKWDFRDINFLTMEEFKESLFHTELPLLKEDKRTIALYNSLSEDLKKRLNIDNYFGFIPFAGNFFTFREELNEETISFDNHLSLLLPNEEILDWQEKLYENMREVNEAYQLYLEKRKWADKIFLYRQENLRKPNITKKLAPRLVFINQYYYTKLEKYILNTLSADESQAHEIIVCYQLPEAHLDKQNNAVYPDIAPYQQKTDFLTEKVSISITNNDFSMINSLIKKIDSTLQANHSEKEEFFMTVIDRGFSAYARFFSPRYFSGRESEFLSNTSIYRFFQHLETCLSHLLSEKRNGKIMRLLPLKTVKELMSDKMFFGYFGNENEHHALLNHIDSLLYRDDYYIDISGHPLLPPLIHLSKLITKLIDIISITDFIGFIDDSDGIVIDQLLSEREKSSDLITVFYNSLANFSAISELQLIEDKTFSGWKHDIQWIMKLFLQNLKPKRIKFRLDTPAQRIDISSLLDSRNISYDSIALLNLSEGVLPSNRITPFLFTESQRKILGLKTYEDIRNREKYYFFRLILNSKKVMIFAQENEESNKEISSFVEELILQFPTLVSVSYNTSSTGYYDYLSDILPDKKTNIITDKEAVKTTDFYSIPLDTQKDFPDNTFNISYSSYRDMLDSPFAFYLKHIAFIDEEAADKPLSAKLVGTIAHYIFQQYWNLIIPQLPNYNSDALLRNKASLNSLCEEVLSSDYLFLKIPKTYNNEFFKRIVLPIIEDNISNFIQINEEILNDRPNLIRPENKTAGVTLLLNDELPFTVRLKGRIDLTIETLKQPPKVKHIFDYKTGKLDQSQYADQLIIYELLEILNRADDKEKAAPRLATDDNIHSYLYSLIEGTQKKLTDFYSKKTKQELIEGFIEKLTDRLHKIVVQGFSASESPSGNKIHQDIIRTDLLRKYNLL